MSDYITDFSRHEPTQVHLSHVNNSMLKGMLSVLGDIPYWIVQNSWGTTWGNEGYVYIKIGANVCGKFNICLVSLYVYMSL